MSGRRAITAAVRPPPHLRYHTQGVRTQGTIETTQAVRLP